MTFEQIEKIETLAAELAEQLLKKAVEDVKAGKFGEARRLLESANLACTVTRVSDAVGGHQPCSDSDRQAVVGATFV